MLDEFLPLKDDVESLKTTFKIASSPIDIASPIWNLLNVVFYRSTASYVKIAM